MQSDVNRCEYLPSVKTLERNFGGIVGIREKLGLPDASLNRGVIRSETARRIGNRGFQAEQQLYHELVDRYHEAFVHYQARIALGGYGASLNVDFLVYCRSGKFAADVFFPDEDVAHYSNNMSVKARAYRNFPFTLFCIIANPKINREMLEKRVTSAKEKYNSNLRFITLEEFRHIIGEWEPFPAPS